MSGVIGQESSAPRRGTLEPIPAKTAGNFGHRFRRSGHTLAIDVTVRRGGTIWITAALWLHGRGANPMQPAFAFHDLPDCYLSAGGPFPDSNPGLYLKSTGFALRPAEYEALRASLLPLGLVHHVYDAHTSQPQPGESHVPAP